MRKFAAFHPVVVTHRPAGPDHQPTTTDAAHARLAEARNVTDGDLILAAVSAGGTDYFTDPYPARPQSYDPACGCGVCCHLTHERDVIVLASGHPWSTCDPWRATDLALIVPAHRLHETAPKE